MACEKCWNDAFRRSMIDGKSQTDHYRDLLEDRKNNPCGPEWESDAYFARLEKEQETEGSNG